LIFSRPDPAGSNVEAFLFTIFEVQPEGNLYEIFQVRMKQIKPELRERAGRIEIWSNSYGAILLHAGWIAAARSGVRAVVTII